MTLNGALLTFMEDTVLIAPLTGETAARVKSYGADVSYPAQIELGIRKVRDQGGRETDSNVTVRIPDRVFVPVTSRVTLPTGFVPQQPPIVGVQFVKFQDLDHTEVYL